MAARDRFGARLTGTVCEIGPGLQPFPTAPGARVTYLDKSVPGGRDATWPELAGQPAGVQADHDVDLDADGLAVLADGSCDGVVAAHVLEHLANPVAALVELERVLRVGGLAAVVMPERHATFDAPRPPTTLGHVLDEHARGVTAVDDDHIVEFCEAIWSQPSFHPPEVRDWHDPAKLDPERFERHRCRSIHAHCWSAEDLASTVVGLVLAGVLHLQLLDVAFHDDPGEAGEFGLLLERVPSTDPLAQARTVATQWTRLVLDDPARDPERAATFAAALARDLASIDRVEPELVALPANLLGAEVRAQRHRAEAADAAVAAVETSRALKVGRLLTAPARPRRR